MYQKDWAMMRCIYLPKKPDSKVGLCTGGAQDYIHKAAAQDCDAYISGEVSERTFMMLRNWMCIIMPAATTPLKNMVYNVWLKLFQNNLILSIVISN